MNIKGTKAVPNGFDPDLDILTLHTITEALVKSASRLVTVGLPPTPNFSPCSSVLSWHLRFEVV